MEPQVAQDVPEIAPREPETVTFSVGRYLWSGLLFTMISANSVKVRDGVDLVVALPPDTYAFVYSRSELKNWNDNTDVIEFAKQYQKREHSITSLIGVNDSLDSRVVLYTLYDGIPF